MKGLPLPFLALSMLSGIFSERPQQKPTNDYHHLVINEIMYAPRAGESEWVEIFNKGSAGTDLAGWTIEDADSTRPRIISEESVHLDAGEYLCLVQDRSAFTARFPHASCPALQPTNGWPRLNNSGDRIVLRNAEGAIVDALTYDDQWGGSDGFSLERIRPDWSTDQPNTWSSSVSISMATPCELNSLFAWPLKGKASITADPDPFDKETIISYRLSIPTAIVKLAVYDIQGRLVKTLLDQELSGSTGSTIWRGESDQGKELRIGIYVLYLEAINAEKGVLDRAKKTVTLAKILK